MRGRASFARFGSSRAGFSPAVSSPSPPLGERVGVRGWPSVSAVNREVRGSRLPEVHLDRCILLWRTYLRKFGFVRQKSSPEAELVALRQVAPSQPLRSPGAGHSAFFLLTSAFALFTTQAFHEKGKPRRAPSAPSAPSRKIIRASRGASDPEHEALLRATPPLRHISKGAS